MILDQQKKLVILDVLNLLKPSFLIMNLRIHDLFVL